VFPRALRFATFLAPNLLPVYAFIARHVGARLGLAAELVVGTSYDGVAGQAHVSFLCGLAYVELVAEGEPLEAVAAPLLQGGRYGGRPVYYSDVIVRRDSPFRRFADLRGRSWSYNEPRSHSGYGVTRYRLVELGETAGYFGQVVAAGWHERSVRLVHAGEVDASAIDSHVLALTLRDHPGLADGLRVIDSFGPSTVQPVVVASWLPGPLKEAVRAALVEMADEPAARAALARGMVERFVPVTDGSYDDLRRMRAACAAAGFLTLR
jgi:phosphonate transport system substrate-binding protein